MCSLLVPSSVEAERPGNGVYFEGVRDFGLASGGDAALVHQGKDVFGRWPMDVFGRWNWAEVRHSMIN